MKRKNIPEKKHAKFSPSASSRWLACPGSISLSMLVPPPPETPAAKEGTDGHTCLETFLKNGKHKMLSTSDFLRQQGFPIEMIMHAESAAKAIWKMMPKGAELLVETKAECFHIDQEMHGTSDATILEHFATLHIIDYKYGKMPVEVGNNAQLMAYAIGVAHKHDYNFEKVKLTVIQPRAAHPSGEIVRSWETTIEHLMWWEKKFKDGVKAAKRKAPDFMAGSHCFFCPGKSVCLEYTPDVVGSMRGLFVKPKSEAERRAQVLLDFGDEPSKSKSQRSKK